MVNVSHYSNNRRTGNEVIEVFHFIHLKLCGERILKGYLGLILECNFKFFCDKLRSGEIDAVVYRFHNAENKQRFYDFGGRLTYFFA